MRYFLLQGPFAQAIFVAFQSGNLICIVTSLLANIGVWLLWRRKGLINRLKTLSSSPYGDYTRERRETWARRQCQERTPSPSRHLSGYEVHVFRILTNFLSFRFITEIISF